MIFSIPTFIDGEGDPLPLFQETLTTGVHPISSFFYFGIYFPKTYGTFCGYRAQLLSLSLFSFISPLRVHRAFLLGPNEHEVHVCVCWSFWGFSLVWNSNGLPPSLGPLWVLFKGGKTSPNLDPAILRI